MKNGKLVLFSALVMIFIGCAGTKAKLSIDDLSIEGQVVDEESDMGLENVQITITGLKGWTCYENTDDDGEYLIDDGCIGLKKHLGSLNVKEENKLDFTIMYDHDDYKTHDMSLLWDLKYKTFNPPIISLEKIVQDEICPVGRIPCMELTSGCCKDCPSGKYWKMENKIEMCKEDRREIEIEGNSGAEYLFIKILTTQVLNMEFAIDGYTVVETEEEGLAEWDENDNSLTILIVDDNRKLEIKGTINNEPFTQLIRWNEGATAEQTGKLEIRWDNENSMFITSWESE